MFAFSLWATVGGDLRTAVVRGRVGEQTVRLTAPRSHERLRISGTYEGPDLLMMLIVGSLAYFT